MLCPETKKSDGTHVRSGLTPASDPKPLSSRILGSITHKVKAPPHHIKHIHFKCDSGRREEGLVIPWTSAASVTQESSPAPLRRPRTGGSLFNHSAALNCTVTITEGAALGIKFIFAWYKSQAWHIANTLAYRTNTLYLGCKGLRSPVLHKDPFYEITLPIFLLQTPPFRVWNTGAVTMAMSHFKKRIAGTWHLTVEKEEEIKLLRLPWFLLFFIL